MTEISRVHAEWAVVDRLRTMLNETPHAEYNVTQSYGLSVAILAWVMQRIRTRADQATSAEDRSSISVKTELDRQKVEAAQWGMATSGPAHADFKDFTAFDFLKWLRDASCHGDARKVFPENMDGELIGFKFQMKSDSDKKPRSLVLTEADLRRIGCALADMYCNALKDSSPFVENARSFHEARKTT